MKYIVNQNAVLFSISKDEKLDTIELVKNQMCFTYGNKALAEKKVMALLDLEQGDFDEIGEIKIVAAEKEDGSEDRVCFMINDEVVKEVARDLLEVEIGNFSDF